VVAAVILPATARAEVPGLADSKLLTAPARQRVYEEVLRRALAYSVVIIPAAEVDIRGLHVSNLCGMRRALAALDPRPDYALSDGFPVDGLGLPALAVWKGDQVAGCVAAASVIAKVTRDQIMVELDRDYPGYGFAEHKGYVTAEHAAALHRNGPCPQHRLSYANVENANLSYATMQAGDADTIFGAAGREAGVRLRRALGSARRRWRSTVSVASIAAVAGGGLPDVRECLVEPAANDVTDGTGVVWAKGGRRFADEY
jgi:ribonuclease HII